MGKNICNGKGRHRVVSVALLLSYGSKSSLTLTTPSDFLGIRIVIIQ